MNQEQLSLTDLTNRARQALADPQGRLPAVPLATAEAGCVVFLAMGSGDSRARVVTGRGPDVDAAWQQAADALAVQARRADRPPERLRAELVDKVTALTWGALKAKLAQAKRNYFNQGIAFDARFEHALLAQEMHGSAVLYSGDVEHAVPNAQNLRLHAKRRFGAEIDFPPDDAAPVWTFTTRAVYADAEGSWPITAEGQATGYRRLDDWNAKQVRAMIDAASGYLAEQVKPTGEFHYGWFPCFDRAIPTYNTLRHASSTYAMLEAWELTRSAAQKAAIDRSLGFLTRRLIRQMPLADGTQAAFLLDIGNEIKLGGNAVCLLALVKYTELTGDPQYRPLMEQLALGIRAMQDPESGRFVHVLNHPKLDVKDAFRVIYYDGEAAFGLMRLYGLTRDPRWLAVVEKAFEHFIAAKHWQAHDHWLSYCVNELTRYRPETRYYEFGVQNVADYLGFVLERVTTFPTLLELMMAAREMVLRMEADPALRPLLAGLDRQAFDRALEHRARYLANGHFWPELAMFFRHPDRVAGSFFIKHHSFRVRIDDVEHYLSGYVAYHRLLTEREAQAGQPAQAAASVPVPVPASTVASSSPVVVWGGDVNLARRQHYRLHELGGPDKMLGGIAALREAGLRIVNLECVVATTGEQGVEKDEGGPYYYRARPEMLAVLTEAGIDMVATANNHSGDYGPGALMAQQQYLDAAGIAHAGTGRNLDAALRPAFGQAGGVRVALFALDATQPRFAATADGPGAAWLPLDDPAAWTATLAPRIAAARAEADVVLVAVHWGANLETAPSQAEIAVGHAIVDAGADAVLGSSAHVLQGIEIYRERPILHDAGDLLFDSIRNDLADSGVFSLTLGAHGVEEVVFTPVGVGFGFSRQLTGESAEALSRRFAEQCRALGTEMVSVPGGRCAVKLSPPVRPTPRTVAAPVARKPAVVGPVTAPRPEWLVDAVPADARMNPLQIGPLRLVGVRCAPRQIVGRRMLWVESFWTVDAPVPADLRIQFRAIPMRSTRMPAWGEGMDHDPCDWMWPTRRWEPGRIYRDRYGLRAPRPDLLESDVLRLDVRVRGALADLPPAQRLFVWCGLRVPDAQVPLPQRPAPVLAALRPGAAAEPAPVWTAEQLQRITGGRWVVEPPPGWFVNSVVRGPNHMSLLPRPSLFIASDYDTLAAHENYSRRLPTNPDRHDDLPALAPALAGAVIAHAVEGLAPDFPLLQLDDPIRGMIALGVAARARFKGFVVGVTGTVGKSSTITMLRDLLPEAARVHTTVDNYNSRVGVPAMLANLGPDADVCILEMAQSGLWMDRGPISLMARPHVAIITEVGLSQTRQTSTLEQTASVKSRIFLGLEPGGVAIVPDHIPCLVQVVHAAARTAGAIWVVGPGPDANIRVLDTHPEPGSGCRVRLAMEGRTLEYLFPIASAGLVRNSTLAFAALMAMGFDADAACARMPQVRLPASVMQVHALRTMGGIEATLIDDSWNAEIMSMRNAMEFVRAYQPTDHAPVTRKIGVLGRIVNLGRDSEAMHRSLAEPLLASGIAHLVTHGAEMRWLREEVPAELLGPHFDDAAQLTGYLGDFLRNGDLVLVKGDRVDSDFGTIPERLQKL